MAVVVEVQTTPDHQVNSGGGCIDGSHIHPPPFSRQRYALKLAMASLSLHLSFCSHPLSSE
jgi:hypothetical protein